VERRGKKRKFFLINSFKEKISVPITIKDVQKGEVP
jgi:hypothetical protein